MTSVEANIHAAITAGAWHQNVMIGDPVLTASAGAALLKRWRDRNEDAVRPNRLARLVMCGATAWTQRHTQVIGAARLPADRHAIVVSNHFAPLENLAVRRALGNHRLFIVSALGNLAMPGALGWLIRHADTLPIANDLHYMGRTFPHLLAQRLALGSVLMYPEQSLWLNYRKPRPGQVGAYHYAALLHVPVISLFVEITDNGAYVVHVLQTLTPDPSLPPRAAGLALLAEDDAQRQAAYARIYRRPYTFADDPRDYYRN